MDQVLVQPKILAYLTDHFVSVRVDYDREREIVQRYKVRGIPDIWFLDSQGKKLKRVTGFISEDVTLSVLKYMNEEAFRNVSFNEFLRRK